MKAFSSVSITNVDDGSTGAQGASVAQVSEEYYVHTSYSSLPSNPQWQSTEPTNVDASHYIWKRLKTTLSDGTIKYSDAVCQRTISGVISRVNTVEQNITNKIWQSDITTSINDYDSTTTQSIRDDVSEMTQDLSGFKTTVSSTYATQTSLTSEINKRKATYVTCSTGASTQAKVGTCTNFELYNGATITCMFSNANTKAAPTLNVNSTGAKTIVSYDGSALDKSEYEWSAGSAYTLVYDGTNWRMQDSGTVTRLSVAESSIEQNAENIELKVSKDGVISSINQSAESITINADKVNIEGATLFSSGRLSETNLNNAYRDFYAVSKTASGTANKTTQANTPAGFTLYNGATVTVKFNNANTATTPTLNVNGTGAKTIKSYTGAALTAAEYKWVAGSAITFVYDGSYWRMQDGGALQANAAAAAAQSSANSAVKSTVSCYYRSSTNSTPTISTSTTIGTSNNTDNTWSYVMPAPKRGCYFYTCEEYTPVSGAKTYSTVRALDSQTYASKWVSSSDNTYIDGGRIYANSVTTSQLATDAIQSLNYDPASDSSSPYSSSGSFFDLSTGNIYTPNFGVQSTTGKAYLNGEIIATSGTIGDDSGNYWEIGNTTDTDGGTSASIVGNGTAYIQDGDFQIHNGASNYSKGSINTQWYATVSGGLKITYPYYSNTYYDYGMTSPILDTTDSRYYNATVSQNFLYIRKHASTIPTLASDWNYVFRVDKDGNAYVNNLYVNGTSIATMISDGVDGGAYLPTSGGTVSGNVTITGTLTATASKAIGDKNGSDITTTYMKLAGTQTASATNTFSGANTFSNTVTISKTSGFVYSGIQNATGDSSRCVWFSHANTNGTPVYNNSFKYNPSTNILTVGSITGNAATATKATQDASGNVITETYAKINDTSLTGTTIAESINSDEVIAGSLIVNGDARFVNTINGDISGNAATATTSTSANSLSSSGTIKVNLASTTASTYTSGGNITPGVSGTLPVGNGGTGKSSWTQYGILYASASNTLAQLGVGTSGQVLTSKGSATPEWVNQSSLSVGSATKDGSGNTISSYYAPKSTAVTNVAYDSTNTKLTKTINGTTTDIVTVATLKSAMSLNNVTNNKQVKGLSSGTTSGHLVTWGSDGYTVADSGIAKGSVTTKVTLSGTDYSASSNAITITKENLQDAVQDTSYVLMTSEERSKLSSIAVSSGGTIDFSGVTASAPLTATVATDKTVKITHNTSLQTAGTYRSVTVNTYGHVTAGTNPTTLSGYGITDAKIASGVITLGSNTITPLTSSSTLSGSKVNGAVAEATKATKDGDNNVIASTYVKKAGDTMSGTLTIKPSTTIATNTPATLEFQITQTDNNITTNGNFIKVYDDHDANNYGGNMVIQSASGVVIGAGESPTAYYNNVMKDVTTEKLTLISDGSIEIFTNANTFANRKGITIDSSLNLYPQTTNTGSVGTSDNKWNAMYATTFYGALSGNASTATALKTSGTIQTNLASTSSATYTSGGNITPGITGTLGVGNGGTGQTTAVNAANAFLSALPTWTADPTDTTYFIRQDTAGANSFGRLPFSTVWNYIKGKVSSVDDIFVKLSGDQTIAGTKTFSSQIIAQSGIAVNTTSGTAGGISLYSTNPTNYGIAMRQTSNSGLHGYVQGDWAIYSYMSGSNATNKLTRGWIFKNVTDSVGVASISGAGNAVFNGSVTVGGNTGNTSGARMEFNSTNNCIDFIFN